MTCSKCLKDIGELQPYFMVDGEVVCYDCKRVERKKDGEE